MIKTQRLIIRKHKVSDADQLVELMKEKSIHKFTHAPYPYRKKDALSFFENIRGKEKRGYAYHFAVFEKDTKQLLGGVAILKVRKQDQRASLGFWIAKQFRGNKYAIEACRGLLSWAFKEKKYNRIELACSSSNIYSKYIIQKLGATYEGKLRKAAKFGTKFHDMSIFSILKKDWPKLKNIKKRKVSI